MWIVLDNFLARGEAFQLRGYFSHKKSRRTLADQSFSILRPDFFSCGEGCYSREPNPSCALWSGHLDLWGLVSAGLKGGIYASLESSHWWIEAKVFKSRVMSHMLSWISSERLTKLRLLQFNVSVKLHLYEQESRLRSPWHLQARLYNFFTFVLWKERSLSPLHTSRLWLR